MDGGRRCRGVPQLPRVAARTLAAFQPQAYILLGADEYAVLDLPDGNRLKAALGLVACRTARELATRLAAEWARFSGPAEASFRRGMLAWAEEVVLGYPETGFELPSFEELEGLQEKDMAYLLEDRVQQWQAEWLNEGREEGRVAGREEGQRDMLEGMAERRFGADAAGRLKTALNGSPSRERLAALGDLIVGSATAQEFIDALDS